MFSLCFWRCLHIFAALARVQEGDGGVHPGSGTAGSQRQPGDDAGLQTVNGGKTFRLKMSWSLNTRKRAFVLAGDQGDFNAASTSPDLHVCTKRSHPATATERCSLNASCRMFCCRIVSLICGCVKYFNLSHCLTLVVKTSCSWSQRSLGRMWPRFQTNWLQHSLFWTFPTSHPAQLICYFITFVIGRA